MNKRGNGEGTIYQDAKGYYVARIMIGFQNNGKPKFKTFSRKQKSAVIRALNEFKTNQELRQPINACQENLSSWLNKWYEEYVIPNVKTSTRVSYEGLIRNHIIPCIGHIKLKDVQISDLEAMYQRLLTVKQKNRNVGLSIKTVRNCSLVIHEALEEALRRDYILKNPASLARIPGSKNLMKERTPYKVLSLDEQRMLLAVCGNDDYGLGIRTALYTGVRLGELLGMQWANINFDKKTVIISKQVNRLKDYRSTAKAKTRLGIQNDTKTKSSNRTITICDELIQLLKTHHEDQLKIKKALGKVYHDHDLVFASADGNYIEPTTMRYKYNRLLDKAKICHYTFHALRHTFATRALEANVAPKVVSNILGHSGVQITLDTYTHVMPQLQAAEMNRIAEYIKSK